VSKSTDIPEITTSNDRNDTYAQVRVIQIKNGYLVRGGGEPVHYPDVSKAADAVKLGIMQAFMPPDKFKERLEDYSKS
jgi:hypothetical protein